jgi:hypothetical protein
MLLNAEMYGIFDPMTGADVLPAIVVCECVFAEFHPLLSDDIMEREMDWRSRRLRSGCRCRGLVVRRRRLMRKGAGRIFLKFINPELRDSSKPLIGSRPRVTGNTSRLTTKDWAYVTEQFASQCPIAILWASAMSDDGLLWGQDKSEPRKPRHLHQSAASASILPVLL